MDRREKLKGRVWKYGKNIDTDQIIPARYCNTSDPGELAKHAMEGVDRDFAGKISPGDIVVADSNFGCGSSRELAPMALKASGVSCVIARSFARIFFRNSINIGLPVFQCAECMDQIEEGDDLEVNPSSGTIKDLTKKLTFQAAEQPPFIRQIIEKGGLMNYGIEKMRGRSMG